ncbi:hypothetical protein MNBD_GAMMA15-897 [hydrothermal vent metagenome]|uniref:GGDEF domain-containing protein n=1 Tax=hydrothermal vent metagenome TaxID=652676 RepID=A0A3B0Y4F9_9ZZZZ
MPEPLSPEQALSLINICPIPLLVLDHKGVICACNPAFTNMTGKSKYDELVGHSASSLGEHPLAALLGTGKQVSWTGANAQLHHYEVHRSKTAGETPLEVRYFIDVSRQLSLENSQHALREELREHTLTDSVTGLLNQRGVMLALEPQVARSRRYNSPISVVTFDVLGNSNNDALRKLVAQQLKDQLRWADLVGCDDKQAFVLVLPETSKDAALQLSKKLRTQLLDVVQNKFPGEDLAAYFGVTGWQRTDSAASLLKRSSMALDQARAEHNPQPAAI